MVAAKVATVDSKLDALKAMFSALREACTIFHETKVGLTAEIVGGVRRIEGKELTQVRRGGGEEKGIRSKRREKKAKRASINPEGVFVGHS